MGPEERRGLGLILLSAAAYGTMPVLAKIAYARGVGAPSLLAWRFVVATLLFALLTRGGAPLPWRRRLMLWGLGLVFVGNAMAYFEALKTVPAATIALVLYSYPVLVTLLSALVGLEALSPRSLLAAGLVFVGCALTAGSPLAGGSGQIFAFVAAIVYATYMVLSSLLAVGAEAETAALHLSQVAAVVFTSWALLEGELALPLDLGAWATVLTIAVLCTVVALRALLAGLARVGPARAAVMSSLEVVVTMALAFALLGERLGPRQWAGAALILGGVAFQNARRT